VIPAGIAGKSPGWRAGAWIIGMVVIVFVITLWLDFPFGRNLGTITWLFVIGGLGFALTVPHARARLREEGPWIAAPDRIAVQVLKPAVYLWYLLFVRLPTYLGDLVASTIWTLYARFRTAAPRRDGRAQGSAAQASMLHGRPQEQPVLPWLRKR